MTHVLALIGQAAPAAAPAGLGALVQSPIIAMLFVVAIFYFMMIRPQQQQQKKHKAMIEALKKGDEIITRSGILGLIYGIADNIVTIEVENGVRFKMLRDQIATLRTAPQTK